MGLRICIDARITSGEVGGVEQIIIGSAAGLSALRDGDEEYVFLTYPGSDWLKPYIAGNCRIHEISASAPSTSLKARIGQRFAGLRRLWHSASVMLGSRSIPIPDGAALTAPIQPDIVHFVIQEAFRTSIPSIFTPFDLQHLHLPENFTARERLARDIRYQTFCDQAALVVACTEWGKADLIAHFGLPPDKVQVIPMGNILPYYPQPNEADRRAARDKFALPDRYVYFPAQTYPSKNHLGLLDALAQLRAQGVEIPLICSGRLSEFYPQIAKTAQALDLERQVKFLGFVSPLEVQCLYQLSAGLVFPSQFEGWGQPVVEAFYAGVPVACSNVTSLPEVAGDAALLFDPASVDEIAAALRRLWQDEALRQTLIARGSERVKLFTWERTTRIFRAHYRRIAGQPLSADDQAVLSAPPFG